MSSGRPTIPQSWNRYSYSINNPLKYTDTTGLDWYVERIDKNNIRPVWYDENPGNLDRWQGDVYRSDDTGEWVALNPWENQASAHDSAEAALGAIEGYRQQALVDFTAGYTDSLSLSAWGARSAAGVNVNENSSQYKFGAKAGFVISTAGAPMGGVLGATSLIGSVANGLRLKKSLASAQQVGEVGTAMAGTGARVPFRDAARIASEHGGSPSEWVKMSSSSYQAADGMRFETHWVENIRTGQRVEFKTKFPDNHNW
jgi:hypothetical protein